MTAQVTCPACGQNFSPEDSQVVSCPHCGQEAVVAKPFLEQLTPMMIFKGIGAALLGSVPGIIFVVIGQPWPLCILIMVLGAFIALAFTFAKLSASNIASLTAGVIIANNVPTSLQGKVIETFDPSDDGQKDDGLR